jgi:hypothetical protein
MFLQLLCPALALTPLGAQATEVRDPFASSQPMRIAAMGRQRELDRLALEEEAVENAGPEPFQPLEIANRLVPRLTLRGFAVNVDDEPIALLEIMGSGTFIVSSGDKLSVQQGGINVVVKIGEIVNRTVFVEVGTLGQTIAIR